MKNRLKRFLSLTGFTLLEILISLTILAILVGTLYTAFKVANDVWTRSEARIEIIQNARNSLEMMTRELKTAMITEDDRLRFIGHDGGEGQPDWVNFIAVGDNIGDTDLYEVVYYIFHDEDTDEYELRRRNNIQTKTAVDDPDFEYSANPSDGIGLGLNVTDLQFQYWDDGTANWGEAEDSWASTTENKLPIAVKMTMQVEDERQTRSERFTTVVYIPGSTVN